MNLARLLVILALTCTDSECGEDFVLINSTTSLSILEIHLPQWGYNTATSSAMGYEVPCGVSQPGKHKRIVGGSSVAPGQFPWQVSVQLVSGWTARHICGGAVLAAYWVVTAAHCTAGLKPSALSIVAGDIDLYTEEGREQREYVSRIVTKQYREEDFQNDIALLQLKKPLHLQEGRIAPVCLPQHQHYTRYGLVSGWGRLAEDGVLPQVLQAVTLPIIPQWECHEMYYELGYAFYLHKCQLCGGFEQGGGDSCKGDSGGPMVCRHADGRYYLCGVVSWGVGCARPNLPGVYTEVACFSRWIRSILYNERGILYSLPADS